MKPAYLFFLLLLGTQPADARSAHYATIAELSSKNLHLAAFSSFQANNPAPLLIMPAFNNISTNWQNAGLAKIGGIPTRSTQCGSTVNPSGLVPPQAGDDFSLITTAIAACTAGQVVVLATGTFNYALSQLPILVNKGITIRGSGTTTGTCNAATGAPCWGTVLQTYDGPQPTYNATPQCGITISPTTNCPNTNGFFLVGPQGPSQYGWGGSSCNWPATAVNPTTNNCGTTLTADAFQGDTSVFVTSTANFSVGMWVLIDENPQLITTTNPIVGQASIQAAAEFATASTSPVVSLVANPDGGNCTYTFCTNRVTEELHLITAINTGTKQITFDSPLTIAYRQSGSHDARLYWPTTNSGVANPFLQQVGIENLTITRCTGGCINFQFVADGWVSNVEVNYWIAGAVNTTGSARVLVTGSYLHNCIDCQNNGNEYPIGVSSASTEVLLENNVIVFGGKGMVGRAGSGNVVVNNYVDKTFYEAAVIGDYFSDMSLNGSHYAGTHGWLFEGNWTNNCDGDDTHGNAFLHTFFRNQCTGLRTTFVDPSNSLTVNDCAGTGFSAPGNTPTTTGPQRAGGPMAFNYRYAFVDNVFGQSGMQSCSGGAFVYGAGATQFNRSIWHTGWTGGEWGTNPDPNLNGVNGTPFIFRNGNFDYVNSAIVDNASGFAHAFPNSLYYSSQPAYFTTGGCAYTWPWIDSTSGTPVKSNSCSGPGLPAKARYDAGQPFVPQ